MASTLQTKSTNAENVVPDADATTPKRSTLRGTPRRAFDSAKKLIGSLSFAPAAEEEFHWVGRPTNVKRNFCLSEDLQWHGDAFTIGEKVSVCLCVGPRRGGAAPCFGTHHFEKRIQKLGRCCARWPGLHCLPPCL